MICILCHISTKILKETKENFQKLSFMLYFFYSWLLSNTIIFMHLVICLVIYGSMGICHLFMKYKVLNGDKL